MKTLRDIGELAVIERLRKHGCCRADVLAGIGDDCAVVRLEEASRYDLLLTSDSVVEGVHFARRTPGAGIGRKAVGRVLSDLAAMGGSPAWCLINLVAPPGTDMRRVEAICAGATRLASKFGLALVGGDTSAGPNLEAHVFAVGRVPRGKAVLRSGALPGHVIHATGSLGGSIKGKHLRFEPRIREGIWLRKRGFPSAMIDVSDGLAGDLRHLMRMSGAGAELFLPQVPVSRAAGTMRDDRTPLDHALFDGEDFELLFTVPPEKEKRFAAAWKAALDTPCSRIGRMTGKAGVLEQIDERGRRTRLNGRGYEHFGTQLFSTQGADR